MKIPIDRVDLGELGYEGYWVEVPRSVREGQLHEFANLSIDSSDEKAADSARSANIKILELVTDWNIDDQNGKVMPVPIKAKTRAEKERIVSEIPVDVLIFITRRVTEGISVPEGTKDF